MHNPRELRTRQRGADMSARILNRPAVTGTSKMVGTVFNGGSIPTTADHYVLFRPTTLGAPEAEGGAGTFTVDISKKKEGLVIGQPPVVGDVLTFAVVNGRWVAYKRGTGGSGGGRVPLSGCSCTTVPTTLTMTPCVPADSFLFLQPCTLTFTTNLSTTLPGTTLSGPGFACTTEFFDGHGLGFFYAFECSSTQWILSQFYPGIATTPLYTWNIAPPNTCNPFTLTNGIPNALAFAGATGNVCTVIYEAGASTGPCLASGTPIC